MYLNNKTYDFLKWLAQLVLPALATLWYAVGTALNVGVTEQVLGTIVAVNVCLGVMLGISNNQYNLEKKLVGADVQGHSEFDEPTPLTGMFSPQMYNLLKWVTMFGLPAVGTLYFTLTQLWGFPYGSEVVTVLTAIATFLGVLLGLSKAQYQKANPNAK